jgi:hypothetical protein
MSQTAEIDVPQRGWPTIHRCPECPSYLNHDGEGGLYCPHEDEHSTRPTSPEVGDES